MAKSSGGTGGGLGGLASEAYGQIVHGTVGSQNDPKSSDNDSKSSDKSSGNKK